MNLKIRGTLEGQLFPSLLMRLSQGYKVLNKMGVPRYIYLHLLSLKDMIP